MFTNADVSMLGTTNTLTLVSISRVNIIVIIITITVFKYHPTSNNPKVIKYNLIVK